MINKNLYITLVNPIPVRDSHAFLSIRYQLTNEQAQGFIAKRDFVNITARQYRDDTAILAAQACVYPSMPPRDK